MFHDLLTLLVSIKVEHGFFQIFKWNSLKNLKSHHSDWSQT